MTGAHARREEAGGERIAMLECPDCGGEQPHRVRYQNDAVAEMICTQCDRAIALPRGWDESSGGPGETEDLSASEEAAAPRSAAVAFRSLRLPRVARTLGVTAVGLSARAATKPWRVWRQVRHEGSRALKTMPGRAATKPLRLARELRHKVRELL